MTTKTNVSRLQKIINESDINKKSFEKFINNLKKQNKVVIYGAGNWGNWLLRLLSKYSIEVYAFLDIRADEIKTISGIPVFDIESNEFEHKEKEESYILIATNYNYHNEIKQKLYGIGYKNIHTINCVWYTGNFDIEVTIDSILNKTNDFLNCAKIFEDEKSYMIYEDAITSYVRGQCIMSAQAERENQYFPEDIPFTKGYSKFIDCGAYTGDTIEKLNENKGKVNTIVAFEPDAENFNRLIETVDRMNKDSIADNIIAYPCGVWNGLKHLNFSDGQNSGSVIAQGGNSIIQCVALDDVLINFDPTFIKMDIEGAEYEALLGTKKIIHKYKPDLAICVYHSITDFYKIPLLINSWNLGYKFYLRCHENYNQEIVMYAI